MAQMGFTYFVVRHSLQNTISTGAMHVLSNLASRDNAALAVAHADTAS